MCILKRLDMSKETTIKFPKVVTSLTIATSDVVCLIPFTTEKCTQLTCIKCNYNLTLLSLTTTSPMPSQLLTQTNNLLQMLNRL